MIWAFRKCLIKAGNKESLAGRSSVFDERVVEKQRFTDVWHGKCSVAADGLQSVCN